MMEEYVAKIPSFADHIRVYRKLYYHHGIYLDDKTVISFGGVSQDYTLDPSKARVVITTLDEFLKGGIVEVRIYTEEEKKKKRSLQDIANYALSCVGNGGYNLVRNNCEHFANECVFGVKKSEQVDHIMNQLFRYNE